VVQQDRHAVSPVDTDLPETIPIPSYAGEYADSAAGRDEEADDPARHIRELISQVLVRLAAVNAGSVNEHAAIGTYAAPEKREWGGFDRSMLPGLELDRPQVLEPGSMLWKQTGRWDE
jgi:hypothetical protein